MGSREELAWAAGFFDGEGSIGAYRQKDKRNHYLRVSVNQIERSVLDRFVAAVGVGKVYGPYSRKTTAQWSFQITGAGANAVLRALWFWLSEPKRQQAERAFAVIASERGASIVDLSLGGIYA